MFGRKQRIIKTQRAIIGDMQKYISNLENQNLRLRKENNRLSQTIVAMQTAKLGINIDFPNSEKGGSVHTGEINVSDILNL